MKIKKFNDFVNQGNEKVIFDGVEEYEPKPKSKAEKQIYHNLKAKQNFCIETEDEATALIFIEYFAEKFGMKPIELFEKLQIVDPEDLTGIPMTNGKTARTAIPEWARTIVDNPKKQYIVMLIGEFSDQAIQNAMMPVLSGKVAEHDISKNCMFVMISETTKSLSKPLLNRLGQKPILL